MTTLLSLAHGLAKSSEHKLEAERLFGEAMTIFDNQSSTERREPGIQMPETYLRIVEDINPDLVPEFLWRIFAGRGPGLTGGTLSVQAMRTIIATARYDRDLAAAALCTLGRLFSEGRVPGKRAISALLS